VQCREMLTEEFVAEVYDKTRKLVFGRLNELTDEELKTEDRKYLTDLYHNLENLAEWAGASVEDLELAKLDVALRYLHRCPVLEKRLAGLKDINETIVAVIKQQQMRVRAHDEEEDEEDEDQVTIRPSYATPHHTTPHHTSPHHTSPHPTSPHTSPLRNHIELHHTIT